MNRSKSHWGASLPLDSPFPLDFSPFVSRKRKWFFFFFLVSNASNRKYPVVWHVELFLCLFMLFNPFGLIHSIWSIHSNSEHFSLIRSIPSNLVYFGLFRSLQFISVYLCCSDHFNLFILFGPLWSKSYSVHSFELGPLQSYSIQFSLFGPHQSYKI